MNDTKTNTGHTVPLTDQMLSILAIQREATGGTGMVLPGGNRGSAIAAHTLRALMAKLGYGEFTVYGFRSCCCGEKSEFSREICEAVLGHAAGNSVEAAYRRGSALDKRRELMTQWNNWVGVIQKKPLPEEAGLNASLVDARRTGSAV